MTPQNTQDQPTTATSVWQGRTKVDGYGNEVTCHPGRPNPASCAHCGYLAEIDHFHNRINNRALEITS